MLSKNKFKLLSAVLIIIVVAVILIVGKVFEVKSNSYPLSYPIQEPSSKFIITADSGLGNEVQTNIGTEIGDLCRTDNCKYMFIAGDVIYPQGVTSLSDSSFIEKFENPYQTINIPIYIAFGNHDVAGCKNCYFDYSNYSKKWHMPTEYYSVKYQSIEFFIINTEEYSELQNKWLTDSLNSSKSKYKVVIGHRPLVTYEKTHYDEPWPNDGQIAFEKTICTKVVLYIAGHSHLLEDNGIQNPCTYRQLNAGGGAYDEDRQLITGADNKSLFQNQDNGFIVLTFQDNNLSFSFLNSKGEDIYFINHL